MIALCGLFYFIIPTRSNFRFKAFLRLISPA